MKFRIVFPTGTEKVIEDESSYVALCKVRNELVDAIAKVGTHARDLILAKIHIYICTDHPSSSSNWIDVTKEFITQKIQYTLRYDPKI